MVVARALEAAKSEGAGLPVLRHIQTSPCMPCGVAAERTRQTPSLDPLLMRLQPAATRAFATA